jgi:hypothetical protein
MICLSQKTIGIVVMTSHWKDDEHDLINVQTLALINCDFYKAGKVS